MHTLESTTNRPTPAIQPPSSSRRPSRSTHFGRAAARLCLLLTAALALAAAPKPKPAATPPPPPANPGVVRLSQTPIHVRTLGLTLFVPEDSRTQTDILGSEAVTRITIPNDKGVIAVQGRRSNDDALTPKVVADGILDQLHAAELLDRSPHLQVAGFDADRFYVQLPPASDKAKPTVHGYTVLVPTPGQVIILELLTTPDDYAVARPVYETTVATVEIADPGDLATRRHAAITAGVRALEQVGNDTMDELIADANNRWERFYTPAVTGADEDATEHGYRRIRAWRGKRGELDPDSKPARWKAADKQEGYLLRIDARLLQDDLVIDSQAIYFLSLDGDDEGWSVQLAVRDANQTTRWSETGGRTGNSMSVIIRQGDGSPTSIKPIIDGKGYIPALQHILLGPILARIGTPADYAFYAYRSQDRAIALRQDAVELLGPDGPIKITSRLNEDAPPQIAYYQRDGSLIRIERPDGRLWEPTTLENLLKLWRSKGLPLD